MTLIQKRFLFMSVIVIIKFVILPWLPKWCPRNMHERTTAKSLVNVTALRKKIPNLLFPAVWNSYICCASAKMLRA